MGAMRVEMRLVLGQHVPEVPGVNDEHPVDLGLFQKSVKADFG
jgi:hypothetical protein